MTKLVIDAREHAVITSMRQRHIPITVLSLDVGDIWLCNEDDDNNSTPLLIIERKRSDDLIASIHDGRWREQKTRMMQTGVPLFYIVEGSIDNTTALSAILNTITRDNIPVLRTESVTETVNVLVHLQTKWGNTLNSTSNNIRVPILSKRKRMLEEPTVFLRQLMCMSGISENIARKIMTVYPTITSLQTVLRTTPDALRTLATSPTRKIGDKLIATLCRGLINTSDTKKQKR